MTIAPTCSIRQPRFHLPKVAGIVERRILVNFRCDPDILAKVLPPPFRPKLVHGFGIAGICLIRLSHIKPGFVPAFAGLKSENAAHRIAVEWDEGGATREGVFIPRRDTNALVNRLAGGRLFPGVHHAASFRVIETQHRFKLDMRSDDRETFVRVTGRIATELPKDSVFHSLKEASEFFEKGALGWSARTKPDEFDGLELHCDKWHVEPLAIEYLESSFFRDPKIFPPGSATFDSAFLMRDIPHEWHTCGRLTTSERME